MESELSLASIKTGAHYITRNTHFKPERGPPTNKQCEDCGQSFHVRCT